jgi:hypothetical protein
LAGIPSRLGEPRVRAASTDDTYSRLGAVAERAQVPATTLAREAMDSWLKQQQRQMKTRKRRK